jgi:hypothetical protein
MPLRRDEEFLDTRLRVEGRLHEAHAFGDEGVFGVTHTRAP